MKLAIIGSRGINIENLQDYIPSIVTEIVSGVGNCEMKIKKCGIVANAGEFSLYVAFEYKTSQSSPINW